MNFWHAFCALADRQPDVAALLALGRSPLSFGRLPSKLDSVRAALNGFGIGRGDFVATALPNGPETAVCLVAISACAVLVPLNPEYSDDEFAGYLALIRPKAIVVPAGGVPAAQRQAVKLGIPIIDLAFDPSQEIGTFQLHSEQRGDPAQPGWNDEDDLASLLLTSGSTGKPKLVPERQHHYAGYAVAHWKSYAIGREDRTILVMPMFHAHAIKTSLMCPWFLGSGVVCQDRFDVPAFFANIEEFRPTWYSAGYTIHHAILDQIEPYRAVARSAGLRFIRSASGRLDRRVMDGLEQAFNAPVVERYGMTETGTLAYSPLPPGVRKPGTVGIPCLNEVRIIDGNGAFLGPNEEGEIVARGGTVFDGYWNDPEANAAAFIDGWFRTGDLGRFDDDGYLTITGRVKDLINRGGEKFSPAEVEKFLCEHPKVGAACVVPVPHPSLGEEVVAAVVPIEGADVTEQELLAYARARLVPFKVPRRVLLCASLPKNNIAKVQRSSVAQMCVAIMAQENAVQAATRSREPSAVEAEILQLWNTVLKTGMTDLDQDFFLAGGDSLKAADLFVRIRKRWGIELALSQIYDDARTIAGLARIVERAPKARNLYPGLVPIAIGGDLPPLFAIPGNDGTPMCFVPLGRSLNRSRPLYGIESPGFDGIGQPIDRMEGIAAENIRRIKAMQPTGPYYLIGYCFGGRVAYEMARQIVQSGERVALLIMLDPSPPFTDAMGRPRGRTASSLKASSASLLARFALARIERYARALAQMSGAERRAFLRDKLDIVWQLIRHGDPFRGDRSAYIRRAVYEANLRAGIAYLPGPYSGPTIICFTRDRPVRGARRFRDDWLRLVPQCGAPVTFAGVNVGAMLYPPNDRELADRVGAWLEDAARQDEARSGSAATLAAAQ